MRQPRKLIPGAKYHVISRATHHAPFLKPTRVKMIFMDSLARAKKRFSFRVDNFCIMDNHFHLIIQPLGKSTLSEIMKWILQVFTQQFNKLQRTWGRFWGDRFYSQPIVNKKSLMNIFSLIDQNPVRAGYVAHASEWEFGGMGQQCRRYGHVIDALPSWLIRIFPGHRCIN